MVKETGPIKWYRLFDNEEQLAAALGSEKRKIVNLGNRKLCLIKHEATYHVFDNLCPHNKHSLLEGHVNYLNEIVCPLHGYRYRLNDGLECEGKSGALAIHKLEIRSNGVFLGVSD